MCNFVDMAAQNADFFHVGPPHGPLLQAFKRHTDQQNRHVILASAF